jgi:hypothetical protein
MYLYELIFEALSSTFIYLCLDYYDSVILTPTENLYLFDITKPKRPASLLYRATRDGFTSSSFHSKCDGKPNTVSIIKTNSNFVLGGYTAKVWNTNAGDYTFDDNAFIFSLRRNGISNSEKFTVRDPSTAIRPSMPGPSFGSYKGSNEMDIYVTDNSNISTGSRSDFGASYNLPSGYQQEQSNTLSYLAGSYNSWLTTEIEVFQI